MRIFFHLFKFTQQKSKETAVLTSLSLRKSGSWRWALVLSQFPCFCVIWWWKKCPTTKFFSSTSFFFPFFISFSSSSQNSPQIHHSQQSNKPHWAACQYSFIVDTQCGYRTNDDLLLFLASNFIVHKTRDSTLVQWTTKTMRRAQLFHLPPKKFYIWNWNDRRAGAAVDSTHSKICSLQLTMRNTIFLCTAVRKKKFVFMENSLHSFIFPFNTTVVGCGASRRLFFWYKNNSSDSSENSKVLTLVEVRSCDFFI